VFHVVTFRSASNVKIAKSVTLSTRMR